MQIEGSKTAEAGQLVVGELLELVVLGGGAFTPLTQMTLSPQQEPPALILSSPSC